jgi:hypothetical protein
MSDLDPAHVQWQKNVLDSMTINGVWGIPQSGARLRKIARDMVYIEERGDDESLIEAVIEHVEAAGYRIANTRPDDGPPSA